MMNRRSSRALVLSLVLLGSAIASGISCSCEERCGACEAVDLYLIAMRDDDVKAAAALRYHGEHAQHLRDWLAEHWRSKHDYCWADEDPDTPLPVGLKATRWTKPEPTQEYQLSIPPKQDSEPMPAEALGADMRAGAYVFTRVTGRRDDGTLANDNVNFVVVRVDQGWKVFCQL